MKKEIWIAIIAGAVIIAMIIGIVIGISIGSNPKETEPQTITLTKENFNEFFTYEVTSNNYIDESNSVYVYDKYYGEIIITFYPLKNFEIANGEFAISIECTSGEFYCSGDAGNTKNVKIPYDGKFSVTFNNYVSFNSYSDFANNSNTQVNFESVSGTIILK